MKKHDAYSIFETEISNSRVEIGVFKSKTNKSFNIIYKFYIKPKDKENFNYKLAISNLKRSISINLPTDIKRSIITHTAPDTPNFNSSGVYMELEGMFWVNTIIPNIKSDYLLDISCKISNNFEEFSINNNFLIISKYSK
jgi:hypothetical protein